MRKRRWGLRVLVVLGIAASLYFYPGLLWRLIGEWMPGGYITVLAGLVIAVIVLLFKLWRRRRYPNLYRKLLNQPRKAQSNAVQYPPLAAGIAVKSLKDILAPHMGLINFIEQATETANVFDKRYWPAIERYAKTVHLLPASAEYHHFAPGGLLHHGLEAGYYTMLHGREKLYGMELGVKKRDGRERWLFACFIAGLCHDLGKLVTDVRVSTGPNGLVWSPHDARLAEWAAKHRVFKYYVDWQADRHKLHESFAPNMLGKVLTDKDSRYLSEIDSKLLEKMMLGLTPTLGAAQSTSPYNIAALVQKADSRSVAEDKKKSRTLADLGVETRTPMARYYTEEMQRLFKAGAWKINEPNGAAWVMGASRDLYLVWPRCGMELYDSLVSQEVKGVPNEPNIIAESLTDWQVTVPGPDGGYYWRIRPGDQDGAPLTVVQVKANWAAHLAGMLPPGLSGMVEVYEGEDASWSYVEASAQEVVMGKPESNLPLEPEHASQGAEAPQPTVVLPGDPMPANAPSKQPPEITQPDGKGAWLRILRHWAFGMFLGFMVLVALLIHMSQQVEEVPYSLAFRMMMGNAFDHGYFVMGLILCFLTIIGLTAYSWTLKDVQEAKKKAAEIMAEAQETKDKAKREADDTVARARSEAGEIEKTAKEKGAEIRIKAGEEAAVVREQAKQKAEAEAIEIMAKAKKQAQTTMDEFWLLLQAKAADMSITPEALQGLVKVLQKAREEAATIMAQAEDKAEEAAEKIIAQAQEEAEEIIVQAKAQAQEESHKTLNKARAEAADILVGALTSRENQGQDSQTPAGLQSAEDQHGQENLGKEETSTDGLSKAEDLQNVDTFINDHCMLGAEASTKASDFYDAYIDWAKKNGVQNPISQTSFGGILRDRGFARVRSNKGIYWCGIALKDSQDKCSNPTLWQ